MMDRRTFLATAGAGILVAGALSFQRQPVVVAMDFASGPDKTVYRLLGIQNGAIREVHRVTGIPRYQMGRDTWMDQVKAGLSTIIHQDGN